MTAEAAYERNHREVKTRRIKFSFAGSGKAGKSRYFVEDDIALSHLVAVLSFGFPPGEEIFIRSVHHYQPQITDPVLKEQVKGFIGQEMTHGREHRNLNDALVDMGYPRRMVDGVITGLGVVGDRVHPMIPLAGTAAAEHFTAVLAARLLSNQEWVDRVATDEEIRNILNWHAFEELEHKAVAFDVYRSVGGSESLRIGSMAMILPAGIVLPVLATLVSMLLDPTARRRPVRSLMSLVRIRQNPLMRNIVPELAAYLRPGFHPDDVRTDALLEVSRGRLFGADGDLAGNLT